jgi:hypothetical protein
LILKKQLTAGDEEELYSGGLPCCVSVQKKKMKRSYSLLSVTTPDFDKSDCSKDIMSP